MARPSIIPTVKAALEEYLERTQIECVFQPIVDAVSARLRIPAIVTADSGQP